MSAQRQPTRRDHHAICELTSQCRRLPSVTCKLKITTKRNPPFEYRRNRFPSPTPSFSLCVRRLWPRSSLICTTPRISIFYWINLPNGTIDVAKNEKKKKIIFEFLQRRARSSTSKRSNAIEIANQAKNKYRACPSWVPNT